MSAEITHHTPTRKSVDITVPAAEVSEAFSKVFAKVGAQVRIPGFRPGKAPKDVLMARFGNDIHNEVADTLVKRHFRATANAAGVQPISFPALEKAQLVNGQDAVLVVHFDVAPEVKAPEYKGLKLTKKKCIIDDTALDEQLETLRQESAKFVPVEDAAAEGHIATLNIRVKPQGMKAQEAKDQVIQITPDRPFDAEILGMKVDETRNFTLTVPEGMADRSLVGKQVAYEATLKDLRKREISELNDDFAKDLEFESLDALKADIRKKLEEAAEQDAFVRLQSTLLDTLLDAAPFEVPASMTALQLDDYCQELVSVAGQQGLDPKKINWGAYRQARLRDAQRAVRSGYLLQAIGNAEDIQVSSEDLDAEVARIAAENHIQQPLEAFKAELERRGSATEIKGRLRTEKIFERLISFAEVTEELLDKEAFDALVELERKREAGLPSARYDAGGMAGGELESQEGGEPNAVKPADEAPESADADEAAADANEEAPKKTPRKKAAKAEDSSTEATSTDEAPAAEAKPKRATKKKEAKAE
ncbi:MAG TPA: trigger factor [Holophaga sp.]|jgi:trigger factor|nr:trigger factor [Holophaga sp.]